MPLHEMASDSASPAPSAQKPRSDVETRHCQSQSEEGMLQQGGCRSQLTVPSPPPRKLLANRFAISEGGGKKRNLPSYSFRRHSEQPCRRSLQALRHGADISRCLTRGRTQQNPRDHRVGAGQLRDPQLRHRARLPKPPAPGLSDSEQQGRAVPRHRLPARGAEAGAPTGHQVLPPARHLKERDAPKRQPEF